MLERRNHIEHSVLPVAHEWVAQALHEGDTAIDATVGNGHDTLFLAQAVGETGRVFGFDVLGEALASTQARLEGAEFTDRVLLIEVSHASMSSHIPEKFSGNISAIMFNLGYLPGHGDKSATTKAETTLEGLGQALKLLNVGGLITIVGYPGHDAGREEVGAVHEWASALDQRHYAAVHYAHLNQQNDPPALVVIERLA